MSDVKRTDAIAGDIIHEYDGIEEADNELPNWWLAIFIGSTLFAGGYWLAYEQFHIEPTVREQLALIQAEQRKRAGKVSDADIAVAAKSSSLVAKGRQAFVANCVVCHGESAEGKIGPNLTDAAWIHGKGPLAVFTTIRDGVPAKGMPMWGPVLGQDAVTNLSAYVLSVRDTNVPGKEPQGTP